MTGPRMEDRGFRIVGVVEYWSDGFGNGLGDRFGLKPNTPSLQYSIYCKSLDFGD